MPVGVRDLQPRPPMRTVLAQLALGAFASLGLLGCTVSGYAGSGGPCDSASPAPACTQSCELTRDCPGGYFCGPDGVCTAECTPGGSGCGTSEHCDEHGQCVADAECPRVVVSPVARTPTVQLVIDRSGSMTTGFGGTSRWAAVRTALTGASGVVTQLENRVLFGATTYSSNRSGACPDLEATPTRAFGNRAAIDTLLTRNTLTDTPTGESLRPVIDELIAGRPPDGGQYTPVILLATDGMPDTCANVDENGNTAAQNLSIMETERAYAAGITTYILSVGNEVGDAHLQKVANAGVGQPVATGTAPFYKANDPAQLTDALRTIITGAISCQLDLSGNIANVALAEQSGIVTLGGVPLTHGTDWRIVDENTIELLGMACDTFRDGNVTLSAEFECGTIIN